MDTNIPSQLSHENGRLNRRNEESKENNTRKHNTKFISWTKKAGKARGKQNIIVFTLHKIDYEAMKADDEK